MILSTTVMVAASTCSLVYLSSGQVFLPCLSLTSHQPFFSRITNTSQKGNLRFCVHHKWFIFGIIERARLSFALCLGFIISRRKNLSCLPVLEVTTWYLVRFCSVEYFPTVWGKRVLVIYKIANYHVYIFWAQFVNTIDAPLGKQ